MASLSRKEIKLIETLINLKQGDTKSAMAEFLGRFYPKVVEESSYIYAEGTIPIAVCAHMDTVWETYKGKKKHLYYDKMKECMWCPEGAGFDDKVGIFLIIKLVTSGLRPCVILSCDEEIGARGASDIAKISCPFKDLKYCIELDRMGSNDCVFYSCGNSEFVDYVEQFGFRLNYGSFTDICQFCPAWGVAGVNLSVGYVDEHSTNERLYVKSMLRTLSRVKNMLTVDEVPFFQYIPRYSWGKSKYEDDLFPSNFNWDYEETCEKCGKKYNIQDLFPVIQKDGSTKYRCYNCLDEGVAWCDYCHEAFETDSYTNYICPKCESLIYGKNDSRGREEINSGTNGESYQSFPVTKNYFWDEDYDDYQSVVFG